MTMENITGKIINLRVLLAGDKIPMGKRSKYVVQLDRLEGIQALVRKGMSVANAVAVEDAKREWAREMLSRTEDYRPRQRPA